MKQTLQQLEPIDVPLKNLLAWEGNVRTTEPDKSIHELAASIEAVGLLHSLVVEPTQRGKYPVIAGKRRLLALSLLHQQGKISRDLQSALPSAAARYRSYGNQPHREHSKRTHVSAGRMRQLPNAH